MKFKLWLESSLNDLYNSAVNAFPHTTKRQHVADQINIANVAFTPFLGVKTLFVKAVATNPQEGTEYKPMILFKGVNYQENGVEVVDSAGQHHFIEQLTQENSQILVKCQCGDFEWRFRHTDHVDKSLYGRNRKKYEALHNPGSANPENAKGMCKHLIKLIRNLQENGFFN
jgi:hypothetical protein